MSTADNESCASFDGHVSDSSCADDHFGIDNEENLVLVRLLSLGLCADLALFVLTHVPQAMKDSQLHSQHLQAQVKRLKAENSTLASQKLTKQPKSVLTAEETAIQHAGGRFAFAHELWIDRTILYKPCPPNVDISCPGRYEDDQKQEITALAEVHESLPSTLKDALSTPSRKETFIHHVSYSVFDISLADLLHQFMAQHGKERAQLVHVARQVAGNILGLSPSSALCTRNANASGRGDDPELRALLHDPNKPGETYPLFAPLVFASKDCTDPRGLFRAEALVLVCH
jgi:hypothetical protein